MARFPDLAPGDAHVWSLCPDHQAGQLEALAELLLPAERNRARRFRFDVHRDRFIARTGLMRTILGRYLELPASRVPFREGEFGKPLLAGPLSRDDLRFNLSHSGQLALLAVTSGREVGVDIELMRPEMLEDTIPEQFFSPYEVSTLRALPEADQLQAFFNCWTRKEAYIKALGVGLQMPLDSFDVTLTPGAPAILLGTRPDTGQTRRWSMHALSPDPAYAGALVVEGPISRLLCWEWAT